MESVEPEHRTERSETDSAHSEYDGDDSDSDLPSTLSNRKQNRDWLPPRSANFQFGPNPNSRPSSRLHTPLTRQRSYLDPEEMEILAEPESVHILRQDDPATTDLDLIDETRGELLRMRERIAELKELSDQRENEFIFLSFDVAQNQEKALHWISLCGKRVKKRQEWRKTANRIKRSIKRLGENIEVRNKSLQEREIYHAIAEDTSAPDHKKIQEVKQIMEVRIAALEEANTAMKKWTKESEALAKLAGEFMKLTRLEHTHGTDDEEQICHNTDTLENVIREGEKLGLYSKLEVERLLTASVSLMATTGSGRLSIDDNPMGGNSVSRTKEAVFLHEHLECPEDSSSNIELSDSIDKKDHNNDGTQGEEDQSPEASLQETKPITIISQPKPETSDSSSISSSALIATTSKDNPPSNKTPSANLKDYLAPSGLTVGSPQKDSSPYPKENHTSTSSVRASEIYRFYGHDPEYERYKLYMQLQKHKSNQNIDEPKPSEKKIPEVQTPSAVFKNSTPPDDKSRSPVETSSDQHEAWLPSLPKEGAKSPDSNFNTQPGSLQSIPESEEELPTSGHKTPVRIEPFGFSEMIDSLRQQSSSSSEDASEKTPPYNKFNNYKEVQRARDVRHRSHSLFYGPLYAQTQYNRSQFSNNNQQQAHPFYPNAPSNMEFSKNKTGTLIRKIPDYLKFGVFSNLKHRLTDKVSTKVAESLHIRKIPQVESPPMQAQNLVPFPTIPPSQLPPFSYRGKFDDGVDSIAMSSRPSMSKAQYLVEVRRNYPTEYFKSTGRPKVPGSRPLIAAAAISKSKSKRSELLKRQLEQVNNNVTVPLGFPSSQKVDKRFERGQIVKESLKRR